MDIFGFGAVCNLVDLARDWTPSLWFAGIFGMNLKSYLEEHVVRFSITSLVVVVQSNFFFCFAFFALPPVSLPTLTTKSRGHAVGILLHHSWHYPRWHRVVFCNALLPEKAKNLVTLTFRTFLQVLHCPGWACQKLTHLTHTYHSLPILNYATAIFVAEVDSTSLF